MSDDIDNNNNSGLSSKLRAQVELQQTEESLRKVRSEIANLSIEIRKHQQDFTRAKMSLESAEARMKSLKNQELEFDQIAMRQKRAFVAKNYHS